MSVVAKGAAEQTRLLSAVQNAEHEQASRVRVCE